jgi:uncharacterized phage infection (PIP) family protein YhgE
MLSRKKSDLLKFLPLGILTLFVISQSHAASVDNIIAIGKQTTSNAAKSQKEIDRLAESTRDYLYEYEQVLNDIDYLSDYNETLEKQIAGQQEEINSLKKQMETIDVTQKGVRPLMGEMIESLEKFIELDLPFRLDSRMRKVSDLKLLMNDPKVADGERFRRILIAYKEELDYGEKFASYTGKLDAGSDQIEVDFLHVGRVLLLYLTLDGKQAGYYNTQSRQFETIDDEYIQSIRNAIKISNKQASPDLIKLPIPAAQGVK